MPSLMQSSPQTPNGLPLGPSWRTCRSPQTLIEATVRMTIESLGNVGEALNRAPFDHLATLYQALHLQIRYDPAERVALVSLSRVWSACVSEEGHAP